MVHFLRRSTYKAKINQNNIENMTKIAYFGILVTKAKIKRPAHDL